MKLTNLLMEDSERIVTGDIKMIHKRFIDQGYKPYKTKDGKLISLGNKITRSNMDYSKGYEDNTVYFLSDKEVEYAKKTEENINKIIELKNEQINVLKQYLPAFIREILNNRKPKGLPKL